MGKEPDKVVLGIDPGTNIMGYGIIHISGNKTRLIKLGVVDMQKMDDHALKLKHIFENTVKLIDEFKPDEVSLEAPFFGKNIQSMLKLGRAQGVAMAAALHRNLPIFEYSPKKIKMSITGSGNASKEQVAAMLKSLLNIKDMPKFLDATDGLAAAMCHYFQNGKPASNGKNYSGWKAFLTYNPARKG
ncbi:MAG: crossover junction endodeoxyribonuclease RuvC [Bacteroidia bacterium]